MTIICRTLRIGASESEALASGTLALDAAIASSRNYSDVYRYWHGIEYLLRLHLPDVTAAEWRRLGAPLVSEVDATPHASKGGTSAAAQHRIPHTQHLRPSDVDALAQALRDVEPEDLAPHYDAAALDAANVYPLCWQAWEETFDPLGQLLEHYHFLRQTSASAAAAGDALLLVYEDDGDEPFAEDL